MNNLYIISLIDNNYIASIGFGPDANDELLNYNEIDFNFLNAYRYVNNMAILDEAKKQKILLEKNKIENQLKIQELKLELATYDYIGNKIATGVATKEDYADKIAYCESLRNKIRELEKTL